MRIFVITMDGIARIMRTYALSPGGKVLIDEVANAPHAATEIAKWHPRHKDQVTNIREIEKVDIPSHLFKDAWEDDGVEILINMSKARVIHIKEISAARTEAVSVLQRRADEAAFEGRTADATKAANDRAAVEGLSPTIIATQIAGAANPTALSAIWPAELQEFRR